MNALDETSRESLKAWFAGNWKVLLAVLTLGILPFLSVLLSGQILFASDQMNSPAWQWYFNGLHRGEFPQWNPFVVGGMPTYDGNAGSTLYLPVLIMGFLLPVTHFMTFDFALHVLIAGAGSYFLIQRYFRLDRWISAVLAVAYMLNTNFISLIYGGHDGKVHILAWLPLSLYFLLRALGPSAAWRHLVGLSLTVAIFIFTSHLQFTYFVLMGYFFVWLYFLIPALRGRRFGEAGSVAVRYWVPVLLGMGLVFFMLYPPIQYNKEFSIRGAGPRTTYEHATSWSMHPEETASLLVPEFGGINENYWGRNYFKLNSEYPGLTVWFLGLLGLFAFRRSRWFWLWGGVGLLSMIYGLGAHTPLFRLFYEFIPGVRVFRAPSMMLFWLVAALLLMSAETLRRLTKVGPGALNDAERAKIKKGLAIGGFSTAAVLALFGLFPDIPFSIWNGLTDASQIPNFERQPMGASAFGLGALRAAVLTGVLTWAVIAFLLKSRRPAAFGLLALVVTVVDLYWVDSHFIQGLPVERILRHDPVVDYLQSDKSKHRVFVLGDALQGVNMLYYGIETVDGRVDNEMVHYRAYRGDDAQTNPNFMTGLVQNPDGRVSGNVFIDMLNVKYIAFRVPNDPGIKLVENATALPRAYFVPAWQAVSDSDAFRGIKQPGFDPRRLAYVTAPGVTSGGKAPDSGAAPVPVAIKDWRYNSQAYTLDAPTEGVLVIADQWFPFWRVKVDGVEAPLLRTNFAFRGVLLKPGRHEVELEYHSPWLRTGLLVSGLSALCLILVAWIVGRTRFGRRLLGSSGA
jgi:hypothetical protein